MEPDRRGVAGDDPGHDRVETVRRRQVDQLTEQQATDPEPLVVPVHVHGVLHGGRVGGALLVGRQRTEPAQVTVLDRHHDGMDARALRDPCPLLVEGAGHQVERLVLGRMNELTLPTPYRLRRIFHRTKPP